MFMPKCPECGGAAKSIEPDGIDALNNGVGGALRFENMRHHAHPHMQLAHLSIKLGREIYKRIPGGGLKQCTKCGHEFR
ncbi:hypothetical protein D0Z70_08245 [Sphingobium terrigena]|uniref:Uncharacterized protein n=1 Tax=Sphingobium terrigena TaxID=2304063 RepID=A0A418YTJ3_9SPHN|nr:hypothetical protein [Sphingobium terrigena]RJG55390.1 hypothetical protein D0Z70_08245 [Sphingobium terrigena]